MDQQNGQPNGTNKNSIYIVVGVVVLALIIWGVYASNHKGGSVNNSANEQAASDNSNNPPAASSTPTSTPPSAVAKLSYGAAIQAYKERFQFNQCQGTPASIAVKKGAPVMLDNRNAAALTIKADTQTFKIAGYDYDVFRPEVVGNIVVTCNGKASVTLNVEK